MKNRIKYFKKKIDGEINRISLVTTVRLKFLRILQEQYYSLKGIVED